MRGFSPYAFLIMEASRWTDARIDDLNGRVSAIADEVRHQSNRIDALQHTIVVVGGSLFAAFVAFLVAMVGLIITLLVTHF
jgi:hypothetical protein